ncbi:MAG: hypothetical protein IIW54_06710, partial [Lachnospiraceae bacterium]|nr:hypothetical protein [Lachnospiraceae bacterium]
MKREDVLKLFPDATPEQLKALLDINGADVEKAKGELNQSQIDYKNAQDTIAKLTNELKALQDSNATAEDYKSKFEALQKDIAEKEQASKEKA